MGVRTIGVVNPGAGMFSSARVANYKKPQSVKDGTSAAILLKDCKNICFLTGAGLSEESGISWYRGTFDCKLETPYGGTTD